MDSFHPKKSLGQHFLHSKEALREIIQAADLKDGEIVLEIGPGEGALTDALLFAGTRVVAVEADSRCIQKLNERFSEAIRVNHLMLIAGDIRDEKVQRELFRKDFLGPSEYKLIANIPYYITGMLFRLFLETLRQPSLLVFLVQKEVAEQVVGRDNKEGILSLAVKAYGSPRYVAKVKRDTFSPPPKVDSAVVAVTDISRKRLGKLRDEDYFRIVRAGLSAKRKMLFGNLAHALKIPKEKLSPTFAKLNIDEKIRGEDVPAEQWISLAQEIKKIDQR
ncbi:MAG: ribosomal RNA small subunit methyltransferase A [Candidatus Lloydbacteria bacterium RIFCSPHIGHO2_02_FULL_50_13]|uniref:Ribosomal RNA small subunit methyltransferase A n=1 Tax=Candidatus Lloydbacteria bacterium RIFCSPHIGHO2_02_FULL_50_13 TaxID=1798661 RepID=A0A1G2D7Y0_9BACT|nr:MAG: ribosomal RNA small subunit methyltransferase A [Candidatus Lloydbacteria bacterium RIFCSPHIGHO2_02_FULL_50_13]